jgi:addiction module HigA family antidote
MDRSRMTRSPTTPGEILRDEYLAPFGMSQKELADHIGQDVKVINRIVNGKSAVTAEVALKLAAAFRTTPEFWLNAQKAVDLHAARSKLGQLPKPLVAKGRPAACGSAAPTDCSWLALTRDAGRKTSPVVATASRGTCAGYLAHPGRQAATW